MGEVLTTETLLGGTSTELDKPSAGTLVVTQEGAEWATAGTGFSPVFIGSVVNKIIARNDVLPEGAVNVAAFSSVI